jgi:fluoride ion exporter CrcB/FEX
MLKSIIAISVGAGLGALLRWWFGLALNSYFPTIPPGTLVANLVGGYISEKAFTDLFGILRAGALLRSAALLPLTADLQISNGFFSRSLGIPPLRWRRNLFARSALARQFDCKRL